MVRSLKIIVFLGLMMALPIAVAMSQNTRLP